MRVPAGAGAQEVADILVRAQVLRRPTPLRMASRLLGLDRRLQAGIYSFRTEESLWRVLLALYRGEMFLLKVTVPEGWRATQIAERLEKMGVCEATPFLILVRKLRLEGFLFPTTYHFGVGASAEKVVEAMRGELERNWTGAMRRRALELGWGLREALTLASIIEREAVLREEMPLISGVYHNRLRIAKPLEADPTVQYALGYWKRGLSYGDLKVESGYNTYRSSGLPPGPICSPGIQAIRAALWPASTQALYFVADNTGGHTFHRTYREHLQAKQRAQEERGRHR
ncbi:MAG: endolytic transglycosylase MltG [Elusimicrobia bacterium]|nr:endolytic transglycosylase MltG [Elusimicrobiota bacterium]